MQPLVIDHPPDEEPKWRPELFPEPLCVRKGRRTRPSEWRQVDSEWKGGDLAGEFPQQPRPVNVRRAGGEYAGGPAIDGRLQRPDQAPKPPLADNVTVVGYDQWADPTGGDDGHHHRHVRCVKMPNIRRIP